MISKNSSWFLGAIERTPGCSGAEGCEAPAYKGSAEYPTTVILCGLFLGNTAAAGSTEFTTAMV
jgi:hypothetical protein